jgi:hypothetical protein
LDTVNSNLGSA